MKFSLKNLPQKLIIFLKEVRLELKRVTWPSRQDTIKNTLLVIGFSLAVAAFLGGLDYLFNFLLKTFVLK
jgi:preprotein translocase subunit SecE